MAKGQEPPGGSSSLALRDAFFFAGGEFPSQKVSEEHLGDILPGMGRSGPCLSGRKELYFMWPLPSSLTGVCSPRQGSQSLFAGTGTWIQVKGRGSYFRYVLDSALEK